MRMVGGSNVGGCGGCTGDGSNVMSLRWSVINNRPCSMLKCHAVHDINKVSVCVSISLALA